MLYNLQVLTMISDQYTALVPHLTSKYSGRKVLAGCVMTTGDDLESAELITVAAGEIADTISVIPVSLSDFLLPTPGF